MGKLKSIFRKLRDPRAENASHDLLEILILALAATLCGAENASDMAQFARLKRGVLGQFLRLENGTPSHDTFSRVFRMLEPEAFEGLFRKFMTAFAKAHHIDLSGVIAVDGKSLRGAYERGRSATPLHLVNAFATKVRMVIASRKAPERDEMTAALEMLKLLRLKRRIVTADALFCSRDFAATVLAREGQYVLALKKNQSKLYAAVERRFARKGPRDTAATLEPSTHDRREWRRATIMRAADLAASHGFKGIAAIARITSRRRRKSAPAEKASVRYYVLSLYMPAKKVLQVVRSRWAIENQLHWLLDVLFKEDANRARKDAAPENFAILRKFAINILRAHPEKISMRGKMKSAGWDDSFLLSLLAQMR
jgi:predicted transposase YbfD/YdcC